MPAPDETTPASGCPSAEVRWISFWIALIFGSIGWLPTLAGTVIAGLGYHWAGLFFAPPNQIFQIIGTAISVYLIFTIGFACKELIPTAARKWHWWRWHTLYAILTFTTVFITGGMFGIEFPFLVAYAATSAMTAEAIDLLWTKPWRPGPSEELLAARRAALRRGEDPSLITADDIPRTSDRTNNEPFPTCLCWSGGVGAEELERDIALNPPLPLLCGPFSSSAWR